MLLTWRTFNFEPEMQIFAFFEVFSLPVYPDQTRCIECATKKKTTTNRALIMLAVAAEIVLFTLQTCGL